MENLLLHIEALIFASEQGITIDEIQLLMQTVMEQPVDQKDIGEIIVRIHEKYSAADFAIELVSLSGGYQFLTKKAYHPVISQLQLQRSKKKLSRSALETLAIIAYRQPVTKLEIEQIRGVNCDYTVQKLLDRDLIVISGKAESVGKPILYATSQLFTDYFGINSIADLPQLKEMSEDGSEIGEYNN